MTQTPATGTGSVPLELAEQITRMAQKEWEDGTLVTKVSPVTADLLRYWLSPAFCETRSVNFHDGQRDAILTVIYAHEVLEVKNVFDLYMSVQPELLQKMDLLNLKKGKHEHPKYAIKMATGTGKTWVMGAFLIWQYLNARHESTPSGRFSKNFLLVAPGLIVYERLLDAYLGGEDEDGTRNFDSSDFKRYEELFVPPAYKDEIFGFLQSSVVRKEEISRKVTGEGVIAITNWHLLMGLEENAQDTASPLEDPSRAVQELLPIRPGTSAGHGLDELDSQFLRGKEIEYLASLPDLVVFNDEAHHIHEVKKGGEISEVEWQKSLNKISKPKRARFFQFDFSATPYNVAGTGKNRTKHFFPHIVSNFPLKTAIKQGLVKTIALDKRKEIASLPLDFKAERESGRVVGLSKGQRIMLRAGLKKLQILEEEFTKMEAEKHPKMMVICEDTSVVPHVTNFLTQNQNLSKNDIIEIHSDRKGNIPAKEWQRDKQVLFSIDERKEPKVIISVLMLREGFDINNICVIVPLRSTSSYILLEQTIGRGLRLMWRGPDYEGIKRENRTRLLKEKKEPTSYLDILSIVEHPAFIAFYDDLVKDEAIGEIKEAPKAGENVLGDIIKVGLREDYDKYDFSIPVIIQDKEEYISPTKLNVEDMEPYPISLPELKKIIPKKGDRFYSEEVTVKTRFGEYTVSSDIFTAKSYNEFISRLVQCVTSLIVHTGKKKTKKPYPLMQVGTAEIAGLADEYIRTRLFNEGFDPMEGDNWRILFLGESKIISHLMKNVSKAVYDLQTSVDVENAEITQKKFSDVSELKMREKFSVDVSKAIYEKLPYPSSRGGFEKAFIEFVDRDASVEAHLKINEYCHDFAHIPYIREDGLLSHYSPDFIVRMNKKIYIVETKSERDIDNRNTKQKWRAALDWVEKINGLKAEDRMGCAWHYALLGENTFYEFSKKGASTEEILEYAMLTPGKVEGTLEDYLK